MAGNAFHREPGALESEEKYRSLFNSIDEGFCVIQVLFDSGGTAYDYRFLEANPAFENQTGLADAIGRTVRELVPDHDVHWFETYGRIALTGVPARFENIAAALGGYYEVYAFRVGEPEQRRVAVLFKDIRERKWSEESTRESERQKAFLLKLADTLRPLADPIEIQSEATRLLGEHLGACRAGYAEYMGGDEVVITRHYAKGVPGVEGRHHLNYYGVTLLAELLSGRPLLRADIANDPTSTEAERAALLSLPVGAMADVPLVKGGRLLAILFVHYRDAHEFSSSEVELIQEVGERTWSAAIRARAEAALRENESRLEALVRAGSESLYRMNADWSELLQIFGAGFGSRGELPTGRWLQDYIYEGDQLRVVEAVNEAIRAKSTFEMEHRVIAADGSVRWAASRAIPILDAKGEIVEWFGSVRDITERKQTEERLRHKHKLESIGLLAGGVAHDFNNLLVGIVGNASLGKEMLPPGNSLIGVLDDIEKAGERAAHLTRQLLAYAGKGRFFVEPVNLSHLVKEMSDLLRPSIPGSATLRLEVANDLPPVEADVGQMQQVVMNLVINAGEAIGERPGTISVRTGIRQVTRDYLVRELPEADIAPGSFVCLEVADTGCGMDEATVAHIFDPFFTTKFTGRGLGLAAVAGVVRGHHGAIKVTSQPGRGSTFLVLLPVSSPTAIQEGEALAPARVQKPAGTILVVDDEATVLSTAKAALERRGHTVLKASSGPAAIEILKREKERVSAVVLDLSMPGMSGAEALPQLRSICPDLKVVISSGYGEEESKRVFAGQEVTAFLQKPYTVSRLAETVQAVLGEGRKLS